MLLCSSARLCQPWLVDKLPAVMSLPAAFDQYRILIIQMPQEAHLLIHHSVIKGRRKSDKTFQNPSVLNLEGYQHSVPCIRGYSSNRKQGHSVCSLYCAGKSFQHTQRKFQDCFEIKEILAFKKIPYQGSIIYIDQDRSTTIIHGELQAQECHSQRRLCTHKSRRDRHKIKSPFSTLLMVVG